MTALPPFGTQGILSQWRKEGLSPGFFRWLEELGRKDEEVKEILINAQQRQRETTWDRSIYDEPPWMRTFANIGATYNFKIIFTDETTEHKIFTEQELKT